MSDGSACARPPVAPNIAAVPRRRQSTSSTRNLAEIAWRIAAAAGLLSVAALAGTRRPCSGHATDRRAGAGRTARRARVDRARRAVLGRRASAHQGAAGTPTGAIRATPARRRRSPGSCRRASRPDPIVWPTPQPHARRAPHELWLRARDDAAHAHQPGARTLTRQSPSILPPTSPGWCARRSAFPARRASTLRCRCVARRLPASSTTAARSIFDAARSALPQACTRPARVELAPDSLTLNSGRTRCRHCPCRLFLPLRRDAGAARGAAAAGDNTRRPDPAHQAQRALG